MIPKIIHYCWFGGKPLPEFAKKCIDSWRKFLPDYEIKEWNEDNFDIESVPYVAEAYKMRKFAFVSDYVRFLVLYKYGGIYFDTDVEVISCMDDIVAKGPFMGCENLAKKNKFAQVAPGLGLGAEPNMDLYREILEIYKKKHFVDENGNQVSGNVVSYTTELLKQKGLKASNEIQNVADIWIYPKDYFCPMDYNSGKIEKTCNTRTIHHYSATWLPWYSLLEKWICRKLGIRYRDFLHRHFAK